MMAKLVDDCLIFPPRVHNGIVGYDRDRARLLQDGWKPVRVEGDGLEVRYEETATEIKEIHFTKPEDYRELRRAAYPELGDVIDALLKAYDGDDAELQIIIAQRKIIKDTIRTPNAD